MSKDWSKPFWQLYRSSYETIGLISGMSWESTATYYKLINETIKEELGGLHSAKIVLYSVDFAEIETYQATGNWEKSGQVLAEIAKKLEKVGADFIVICTNTMHKIVDQIQRDLVIPILHIAEVIAEALLESGVRKVGLLGTKYTMTQAFYKDKLVEADLDVLVPSADEIEEVNRMIYDELCKGETYSKSRATYLTIIKRLKQAGAEAVILGCTEIGLLVQQDDTEIPLFDTTTVHAVKAALATL
ncbi:aspartate/glutamate racemase family protein [Streptococcus sp. S784/96/1]|uniref:aspartate/glutamate racemase family protein n=1 Tax=Streptococcus sp. S784/96/1 TaxID=2653499 RepID=UPI00236753DE|nr:aspartate/glutamate racemase family protein [Streptococcus sp. S784/96/1]